ncbi:MAG: peptide chain release factor 1 [Acidimicrobiia bacterium]|nr:peptide chain release factor 1 [Acidimicrobiia bacterium]NNF69160.1 peptide chain release factor 1 [Acidimicrobiia bacterium]
MDAALAAKLDDVVAAFDDTLANLADPEVLSDQDRYRDMARRHSELKPITEAYQSYMAADTELAEAREMRQAESDAEMVTYLDELIEEKATEVGEFEQKLRLMLVPKDPNDQKDVIVEIRSAAGGDEAALWAGDLYEMYSRYADRHGWTVEPINVSFSDTGGLKDATFAVKGDGAYSRFKYEAGPHRVQRVPKTESQGRIHTSVATVAVLPEAEAVEVDIHENDLDIEVFRSSGPGGQSVNTTDSAVRITHKPTGLVVSCQDEKSQLQNKTKAMRVLRARLLQQQLSAQAGERASERRSQVGTGERSEKIRTYNFKENRITDHRIGETVHNLPEVLAGDLDHLHDALMADDQARKLAEGVEAAAG